MELIHLDGELKPFQDTIIDKHFDCFLFEYCGFIKFHLATTLFMNRFVQSENGNHKLSSVLKFNK